MAKISFITFGCSVNFADSELMAGILKKEGHDIVEPKAADLVVINSCTVKNMAEAKLFRTIRKVKALGKKVVVAGCVAQAEHSYLSTKLKGFSILGTKQLNKIAHVVEETLEGNCVQLLGVGDTKRDNIPKIRRNKVVGIVPISEGCLGNCTYCKARFARGNLKSYSVDSIIREVKSCLKDGCKEIWLTSQDCGAYGKDIGEGIVPLLTKVMDIEGNFHVRLGMANPNFIVDCVDDLIKIFKKNRGKMFRFIHIPVQSGNNRVLKAMKRRYSRDDFLYVVKKLRSELPDITIATDIICGFPGETDEEFKDSISLVRETQPDIINISRFWPRPGTEAAALKNQLPGRVTNERSRLLRKELEKCSTARNRGWEGWQGKVIVDEVGKDDTRIGRNYAYKPVGIKKPFPLGSVFELKVKKAHTYYLEA